MRDCWPIAAALAVVALPLAVYSEVRRLQDCNAGNVPAMVCARFMGR